MDNKNSKTKNNKNASRYIQESLACISFLLKNTDSENLCSASSIIDYINDIYGYAPLRQRIALILNILSSKENQNMTRKLGFVVSAKSTGKDKNRKKFYISERLLTMMEINAIHLALKNYKTPLTGSKRIDDIVEGLKYIYPCVKEEKKNIINENRIVSSKKNSKLDQLHQIINSSYVNKNRIKYHLFDDPVEYHGRVIGINFIGGDNYELEVYTEDNKVMTFKYSDIKSISPLITEKIEFNDGYQLIGNLNLSPNLSNKNFGMNRFINMNENKVIHQLNKEVHDKKIYLGFSFNNIEIISSFMKEFHIDLLQLLENQAANNNKEGEEENNTQIKKATVNVYVPRQQFIIWASRPENILDIDIVYPAELIKEIRDRINYFNIMAQKKFDFTFPRKYNEFRISLDQNNEISIDKLLTPKEEIVIPDYIYGYPVTQIGMEAFSYSSIEKVTLGNNIERINSFAFMHCSHLKEVIFNKKLSIIQSFAFKECTNLKSVNIDSKISDLGAGAFEYCTSLENVVINNEVYSCTIRYDSFQKCKKLKRFEIKSVTIVDKDTFKDCSSLEILDLGMISHSTLYEGFINNANTKILITYKDYIPSKNGLDKLSCYKQMEIKKQ